MIFGYRVEPEQVRVLVPRKLLEAVLRLTAGLTTFRRGQAVAMPSPTRHVSAAPIPDCPPGNARTAGDFAVVQAFIDELQDAADLVDRTHVKQRGAQLGGEDPPDA
jgi:hypothetical protein